MITRHCVNTPLSLDNLTTQLPNTTTISTAKWICWLWHRHHRKELCALSKLLSLKVWKKGIAVHLRCVWDYVCWLFIVNILLRDAVCAHIKIGCCTAYCQVKVVKMCQALCICHGSGTQWERQRVVLHVNCIHVCAFIPVPTHKCLCVCVCVCVKDYDPGLYIEPGVFVWCFRGKALSDAVFLLENKIIL